MSEAFLLLELVQKLVFEEWQSFKNGASQESVAGAADQCLEDLFSVWKSEICVRAWQEGSQTLVPPFSGRCPNY